MIGPAILYATAFVVGMVVMGLEMVASRYLYPYFGSATGTWAGLISVVLLALTAGYIGGGRIADRWPTPKLLAAAVGVAALFLAWVPALATPAIDAIQLHLGDGPAGILAASAALLLLPCTLLGILSPVTLRLLIVSRETSGGVAGLVYGVSTMGNVAGILLTTFALMPLMGSRSLTYLFALVLAGCAVTLWLMPWRRAD
jgi:MFS family permease